MKITMLALPMTFSLFSCPELAPLLRGIIRTKYFCLAVFCMCSPLQFQYGLVCPLPAYFFGHVPGRMKEEGRVEMVCLRVNRSNFSCPGFLVICPLSMSSFMSFFFCSAVNRTICSWSALTSFFHTLRLIYPYILLAPPSKYMQNVTFLNNNCWMSEC